MGGKGFSPLSNVGVGTGNSEVVCIGVGEKVEGRGYANTLRDLYSSMKWRGEGKVVSAAG